jgi:peroxiredoxin
MALVALIAACHPKETKTAESSTFELSGKLNGGGEGISIYLDRVSRENVEHLDSTKLGADGSFTFHTKGIYKGFYVLRITQSDFAMLVLDSNEKVVVSGNSQFLGDTYSATGSPDTKIFCDFNSVSKVKAFKLDSLRKHYSALINASGGNKKRMDSIANSAEAPFDSIEKPYERYVLNFIKSNLNSFATLAAIQELDGEKYLNYYIALDSCLSKEYPNSSYIKVLHNDVEGMRHFAKGTEATEIDLPDTSGKEVKLSQFRGKVVLVDFWASWCGPCRESLPGIVRVFNKYKNKNFTILSVSLDKDKDNWLTAIHKYHLTWTHVSDLKYWDSKVVPLYNISAIPFSVLLSPDGKIVDKNLSEADLDAEIGKLLNEDKKS